MSIEHLNIVTYLLFYLYLPHTGPVLEDLVLNMSPKLSSEIVQGGCSAQLLDPLQEEILIAVVVMLVTQHQFSSETGIVMLCQYNHKGFRKQ